MFQYFFMNLFSLCKAEALAEHVSWSRVSRVTLISMEFSSVDHSWSWHLPRLQHFKSDLKNLNPADQSSVYQTYLSCSGRILTFLELPPPPRLIIQRLTPIFTSKGFNLYPWDQSHFLWDTSFKSWSYDTGLPLARISLGSWSELSDIFLAASRAPRDQYSGESVLSQNLCGQISLHVWMNNHYLCSFINSSSFLSYIRILHIWALWSTWTRNVCFDIERIWLIQLRQMSNYQFSLPSMKIVAVICSNTALAASGSIVNAQVQPSMSIVIMIGFASSASTNDQLMIVYDQRMSACCKISSSDICRPARG